MFGKLPIEGKKTICLVSGGNIDVTILSRVINRGLQKSGRSYVLTVELMDRPGQLVGVTSIIERAGKTTDINACYLQVVLETRNQEHIDKIRQELVRSGYHVIV